MERPISPNNRRALFLPYREEGPSVYLRRPGCHDLYRYRKRHIDGYKLIETELLFIPALYVKKHYAGTVKRGLRRVRVRDVKESRLFREASAMRNMDQDLYDMADLVMYFRELQLLRDLIRSVRGDKKLYPPVFRQLFQWMRNFLLEERTCGGWFAHHLMPEGWQSNTYDWILSKFSQRLRQIRRELNETHNQSENETNNQSEE